MFFPSFSRAGTPAIGQGQVRVTFSDPFTGVDASAPNARWTPDAAGWEINTNHLRYTGATALSFILTPCTPGTNTVTITGFDCHTSLLNGGYVLISWVDANNYAYVKSDANGSPVIGYVKGGVNTTVLTSGHTRFVVSAVTTWVVNISGTTVTSTVTGGLDPGVDTASVDAAVTGGSNIGLGMKTGALSNYYDACALS